MPNSDGQLNYPLTFLASGILGLLEYWFQSDTSMSYQELAILTHDLVSGCFSEFSSVKKM